MTKLKVDRLFCALERILLLRMPIKNFWEHSGYMSEAVLASVALVDNNKDANLLFLNEKDKSFLVMLQRSQKSARESVALIRSMLALVACIQRHRGATMALLGGDNRFADRIQPLQKEISLRIDLLRMEADEVVEATDKDNILGAWKTISHNWQDDAVLENFEYQSHLIEYLLRMVRLKGDSLVDSLNQLTDMVNDPVLLKNLLLLNSLSCTSIPDCFELLAKLRGMATHAAASNQCDGAAKSRMDFLLKELSRLTAKMDHQIHELDEPVQKQLIPGNQLAQAKVKRDYLSQLLSNDIVEGVSISLDSEMVYRVSSEVIDTYYTFAESIMTYLENQMPKLMNRCLIAMN